MNLRNALTSPTWKLALTALVALACGLAAGKAMADEIIEIPENTHRELVYNWDGYDNPALKLALTKVFRKAIEGSEFPDVVVTWAGRSALFGWPSTVKFFGVPIPRKYGWPSLSIYSTDVGVEGYLSRCELSTKPADGSPELPAWEHRCLEKNAFSQTCYATISTDRYFGDELNKPYTVEITPDSCPFLRDAESPAFTFIIKKIGPRQFATYGLP